MTDSTERWLAVAGYEESYEVSNLGNIRRVKTMGNNRFVALGLLKPKRQGNGYLSVHLLHNRNKHYVHRLVATAFCPKPDNDEPLQINHKDGDKTNNQASNLEWCTAKQNSRHNVLLGRVPRGERHYNARLTIQDVMKIRELFACYQWTIADIATCFDISHNHARDVATGKKWTHVPM